MQHNDDILNTKETDWLRAFIKAVENSPLSIQETFDDRKLCACMILLERSPRLQEIIGNDEFFN